VTNFSASMASVTRAGTLLSCAATFGEEKKTKAKTRANCTARDGEGFMVPPNLPAVGTDGSFSCDDSDVSPAPRLAGEAFMGNT
jgi:hypothetical protein